MKHDLAALDDLGCAINDGAARHEVFVMRPKGA